MQETEIVQNDRDKKVMMMTCQVMVKENIYHCLEGDEVIENDVLIKSTPDKNTPDRNTPDLYSRYGDYPVSYVVLHQDLPLAPP